MQKAASEADNVLNVLRDTEGELAALGTQEPPNWSMMSYDQKVQYLDDMKNALQGTQQLTNKLQDANEQKQKQMSELNGLGVDMNDKGVMQQIQQSAKRNVFNLKRFSQIAPPMEATPMAQDGVDPSLPQTDAAMPPTDQSPTAKVRQLLDGVLNELLGSGIDEGEARRQAPDQAYSQITSQLTNPNESTVDPNTNVQGNSDQAVRDAVNTYYSTQDENEKDSAASVLARTIFPQDDQNDSLDQNEVPAVQQEGVKVNLANFVKETNEIIKKLAQSHAKSSKINVFNLTKHAHVKNMFVFDPEKAVKDEFYGGAMSENDLLERNKGYGIKLDGFYSLNWEKVWRENVMDKYDPFYLERRFEVDKNVPPTNNYQLAAGEKRRITPPEYGNTEARLEANRTKMNEERGYSPADKGEPFNWKKAQQSKKAQTVLPKADLGGGTNPLKPAPMQKQEWLCHACHNALEVTDTNTPMDRCTACGALQNGKAIPGKFKTGPDPAKTTAPAGTASGPIHASGDTEVEKLANAHGGIFFDSNELKFVVFAGKKKKKFDTYYEAEEFKMLVKDPSAAKTCLKVFSMN
jgi:hypothetical protein